MPPFDPTEEINDPTEEGEEDEEGEEKYNSDLPTNIPNEPFDPSKEANDPN